MKFLKSFFVSIFIILILFTGAKAEFFSDVILTGIQGIWVDSRSYSSLSDAVTAIGANDRELVIVSPQSATSLIIPSNIRLKFIRNGSITNSGQLTINTKNIEAENRQIFTGVGNIDFASGSVVKTGWFSNIETAFALTANDTVTLVVSKPQTITANYSPGNNVHLKWEAPGNILTVNAGVVVGNLKNIEAGNFQIFAGAGDFDFLDGAELKLSWFNQLSDVLTWVENEKVTIIVNKESVVQASVASTSNEIIKIVSGGIFNLNAGVVLTLGSQIDAGDYQIFSGVGSPTFASSSDVKSAWFLDFETAVTKIGSGVVRLIVSSAASITNDCTINANTTLVIPSVGRILTVANTKTLTINGSLEAGAYQIFSGTGTVVLSSVVYHYPEWYSSGTFSQATIQSALTAIGTVNKITLLLRPGTWVISSNVNWSAYTSVVFKIVPGALISHGAYTVNIPNPTTIGLSRMFSGTGTVTISGSHVNELYPEWWTENTVPGTTSMTAALNSAVATANASGIPKIKLGPRKYSYTGLTIPDGTKDLTIEGTAVEYYTGSTQLWFTPITGNGLYIEGEADYLTLRNLTLNAHGAESDSTCIADSGLVTKVLRSLTLDHVHIYGWKSALSYGFSVKVSVNDCYFSGQGLAVASGYGIVVGVDAGRSNNLTIIRDSQIVNYSESIWNRYGTSTTIDSTTMSLAAVGLRVDQGIVYVSNGYFESDTLAINKGVGGYIFGNWQLTGTTPAAYTLSNHRFGRDGYQNSRLVAYDTAAQTITGGAGYTVITLQHLEESDDGSYVIATDLYTARYQGHYLITPYVTFSATAGAQSAVIQVWRSTGGGPAAAIPYFDLLYWSEAAGTIGGGQTRLIWLEAGDTLQVKASTTANMDVPAARLDVVSLGQ